MTNYLMDFFMFFPKRSTKANPNRPKQSGPRDAYIGQRLQLARSGCGISQETLAQALKISFQQVQKYESGVNRVSATRLYEIARCLSVPITFFFDGIESVPEKLPPVVERREPGRDFEPLLEKVSDEEGRKRVLKLLRLDELGEPEV